MTYRVQLLRGEPITDCEVAQTAQGLPSVSMKLLNEARLELAIIIRDNIYQSSRLQDLLYTKVPELVTRLDSLTAELAEVTPELAAKVEGLSEQLAQAKERECPDPELHADGVEFVLAELVREEHNRTHHDPWAVCRYETCRECAQLVKP
jgi:hypothetical protein